MENFEYTDLGGNKRKFIFQADDMIYHKDGSVTEPKLASVRVYDYDDGDGLDWTDYDNVISIEEIDDDYLYVTTSNYDGCYDVFQGKRGVGSECIEILNIPND